MNVSVFVTMWMTAMSSVTLNDHFLGEPLAFLKTSDQVNSVEFYTPYTGAVPKLDDIPAPHLLIEIKVKSWEGAQTLTAASNFKRLFTEKTGILAGAEKINVEILEAVHYDIPGPQATPARTAPFSFVVRYYGPVANAADFTEFYTRNHPPLLAQFPNIRNVLCYLPRAWNTRTELTDDTLILGNEVVFDNIEDFVAAIESDAMGPVMADGDRFESYGYSSHHAMHRKVVFSRR